MNTDYYWMTRRERIINGFGLVSIPLLFGLALYSQGEPITLSISFAGLLAYLVWYSVLLRKIQKRKDAD